MNYDVSVVIVNFNGRKYINTLFDSLLNLKTKGIRYEIVFVDNNSSDDSILFIEENYKKKFDDNFKIVASRENLGFAGGNNLGVDQSSGEFIIFLNNDTAVDEYWLTNMYNAIIENQAGIVTSKLVFFYDFVKIDFKTSDKIIISNEWTINDIKYKVDPKFCKNLIYNEDSIMCFGNSYIYIPLLFGLNNHKIAMTVINSCNQDFYEVCGNKEMLIPNEQSVVNLLSNQINKYKITLIQNVGSGIDHNYNGFDLGFCIEDHNQFNEYKPVDCACGAAMIVKKTDFEQVGKFDEAFFMYYEDADLSFRIKQLGKPIVYCPEAIVRHFHTGSSKEWSPFFIYYVFRNRLLFILKNYSFSVFLKQFIKFNLHVSKTVLSKTQSEIKKAKIKALISVWKCTPGYLLKR